MKKLLLASTALVATAGFAAADVDLTGSAEMGIIGGSELDTQYHTDIDVKFTLSGESDNGISFGATIDLDEEGGFSNTNGGPESVFVSAGGATLTMGDTDGAFDARIAETGGPADSINDDHTEHTGFSGDGGLFSRTTPVAAVVFDFNGDGDTTDSGETVVAAVAGAAGPSMGLDGSNDGQVARFDYTFDAFTGSLSAEVGDDDDSEVVWGLGVSYNAELAGLDLGVGIGWQKQEDTGSVAGLSLSTTFANGLSAVVKYSKYTEDGALIDHSHTAIGLGYEMNALQVGLNWGMYRAEEDGLGLDSGDEISSGVGLAVNYDLGGGLDVQFGYGSSSINDDIADPIGIEDQFDTWSLGLAMSF